MSKKSIINAALRISALLGQLFMTLGLSIIPILIASVGVVIGFIVFFKINDFGGSSFTFILSGACLSFLAEGILSRRLVSKVKKTIKSKYPKLSVVGIMQIQRRKKNQIAMFVFVITALSYYLTSLYFSFIPSSILLTLLLIAPILLFIREQVIQFRIKKGWYGQNESEAREIIKFVIDNADKIDFTDNGTRKPIISEDDMEEIISSILNKQPVEA